MNDDLRDISKDLTEFIQKNEKKMPEELKRFILIAKDQLTKATLVQWRNNVVQFPKNARKRLKLIICD